MKKKQILIIAITLVLIVVSLTTIFMFSGTDGSEDSFNSLSNNSTNVDVHLFREINVVLGLPSEGAFLYALNYAWW